MRRVSPVVVLFLLAACGGGRGPGLTTAAPVVASGGEVVEQFMQAVGDSNLTLMGQLWGTARGPAAVTGDPANWRRRIEVIQLWLRGGTHRVLGDASTSDANRRTVTMELTRDGCSRQVPIVVHRLTSGGWIITNINIDAAGNPARPCATP